MRAPHAREVSLALEGQEPTPLHEAEAGVFAVTTPPLAPDWYGYTFVTDGVSAVDPSNPLFKPSLLSAQSLLHVPGPASLPWEAGDVPRGVVHRHFYRSGVVREERDFYVYTPPGYDGREAQLYPVLYLLHGFSDDASAWTAVGKANVVMDNLIAHGKVKPTIVVMPLGYGAPEILGGGVAGFFRDAALRKRNFDRFRESLWAEVMPHVESVYRVKGDRAWRAIAGLSMGGTEALLTGLNGPDKFAWIGAFSSGGLSEDFDAEFPLVAQAGRRSSLLWIACGNDDPLLGDSRRLRAWLTAKGVDHKDVDTPGGHTWMVWRRNLAEFASLLFRDP